MIETIISFISVVVGAYVGNWLYDFINKWKD